MAARITDWSSLQRLRASVEALCRLRYSRKRSQMVVRIGIITLWLRRRAIWVRSPVRMMCASLWTSHLMVSIQLRVSSKWPTRIQIFCFNLSSIANLSLPKLNLEQCSNNNQKKKSQQAFLAVKFYQLGKFHKLIWPKTIRPLRFNSRMTRWGRSRATSMLIMVRKEQACLITPACRITIVKSWHSILSVEEAL